MYRVAFLVAASLGLSAQDWAARRGLTASEYLAVEKEYSSNGLRPACISGYSQGGEERYGALFVQDAAGWRSRIGLTPAEYQSQVDTSRRLGFRLAWVSAHNHQNQVRYAAIWVRGSGPDIAAFHGLSAAEYQQTFNTQVGQGFRPVHVSVHVERGQPRFAVIFEKSSTPDTVARHGMTSAEYQAAVAELTRQGFRMRAVAGYRPGNEDLFAAIWEKTPGRPWSARHAVPIALQQSVFDNHVYQAYRPTYISIYNSGDTARVNSVWENRVFRGSELSAITERANRYRNMFRVPGIAFAITKDGRLVYAAGSGTADPATNEEASPTHLFRIGSISKPITAVAILRLAEMGRLSLDDRVFGRDGILDFPVMSFNRNLEDITVRHLLQHVAGFSNTPNDPTFREPQRDARDLIRWVLTQPERAVTRQPGTLYEYNNLSYFILGEIVAARSGTSYANFVTQNVLTPAGAQAVRPGRDAASARQPREVVYVGDNAYSMQVERGLAAGGWIASPIDLMRFFVRVDGEPNPPDIIRADTHAAMTTRSGIRNANNNLPNYGMGWGTNPQGHNGAMAGTIAVLSGAGNGFAFVAMANTRPSADPAAANLGIAMREILGLVANWPNHNLF